LAEPVRFIGRVRTSLRSHFAVAVEGPSVLGGTEPEIPEGQYRGSGAEAAGRSHASRRGQAAVALLTYHSHQVVELNV
jgi:hypothetical protein